jgi:hypothetical protein
LARPCWLASCASRACSRRNTSPIRGFTLPRSAKPASSARSAALHFTTMSTARIPACAAISAFAACTGETNTPPLCIVLFWDQTRRCNFPRVQSRPVSIPYAGSPDRAKAMISVDTERTGRVRAVSLLPRRFTIRVAVLRAIALTLWLRASAQSG